MPDYTGPALGPSAHADTFCRDNLPPPGQWPEFLFGLPGLSYPAQLNAAAELLDVTAAKLGPDRRCLLTPHGESWTYGDLQATTDRIANVLTTRLGVVPGNRVLLRGPNNPWLAACWLAVLKTGAVAVPTMPLLRASELTAIASIARPMLALCDARFTGDLLAADLGGAPAITYGGPGEADLTALARQAPAAFTAIPAAADDVALLAFTSGTTGKPKATMHFHRDLLAVADTFSAHVLRPEPDDLFTGTPPLAFTFGLGGLVLFPMRVGAATLLLEKATPDQLADAIEQHGVTVCFTAPTAYRAMLKSGRSPALRTLRRAVSAGEHLPESTWHAFREATGVWGAAVVPGGKQLLGLASGATVILWDATAGREVRRFEVSAAEAGHLDLHRRQCRIQIQLNDDVPDPDFCSQESYGFFQNFVKVMWFKLWSRGSDGPQELVDD